MASGLPVVAARAAMPFVAVLAACSAGGGAAPSLPAPVVHEVEIAGYSGVAMEPFVSRDGRFLLFNDSNDPATNTELHFARRIDALHWTYGGPSIRSAATSRGSSTSTSTSTRRARS